MLYKTYIFSRTLQYLKFTTAGERVSVAWDEQVVAGSLEHEVRDEGECDDEWQG